MMKDMERINRMKKMKIQRVKARRRKKKKIQNQKARVNLKEKIKPLQKLNRSLNVSNNDLHRII
jgi:hypothetical protein